MRLCLLSSLPLVKTPSHSCRHTHKQINTSCHAYCMTANPSNTDVPTRRIHLITLSLSTRQIFSIMHRDDGKSQVARVISREVWYANRKPSWRGTAELIKTGC